MQASSPAALAIEVLVDFRNMAIVLWPRYTPDGPKRFRKNAKRGSGNYSAGFLIETPSGL